MVRMATPVKNDTEVTPALVSAAEQASPETTTESAKVLSDEEQRAALSWAREIVFSTNTASAQMRYAPASTETVTDGTKRMYALGTDELGGSDRADGSYYIQDRFHERLQITKMTVAGKPYYKPWSGDFFTSTPAFAFVAEGLLRDKTMFPPALVQHLTACMSVVYATFPTSTGGIPKAANRAAGKKRPAGGKKGKQAAADEGDGDDAIPGGALDDDGAGDEYMGLLDGKGAGKGKGKGAKKSAGSKRKVGFEESSAARLDLPPLEDGRGKHPDSADQDMYGLPDAELEDRRAWINTFLESSERENPDTAPKKKSKQSSARRKLDLSPVASSKRPPKNTSVGNLSDEGEERGGGALSPLPMFEDPMELAANLQTDDEETIDDFAGTAEDADERELRAVFDDPPITGAKRKHGDREAPESQPTKAPKVAVSSPTSAGKSRPQAAGSASTAKPVAAPGGGTISLPRGPPGSDTGAPKGVRGGGESKGKDGARVDGAGGGKPKAVDVKKVLNVSNKEQAVSNRQSSIASESDEVEDSPKKLPKKAAVGAGAASASSAAKHHELTAGAWMS
jgi:hypothetical protein